LREVAKASQYCGVADRLWFWVCSSCGLVEKGLGVVARLDAQPNLALGPDVELPETAELIIDLGASGEGAEALCRTPYAAIHEAVPKLSEDGETGVIRGAGHG
jgi:hypothetical protein